MDRVLNPNLNIPIGLQQEFSYEEQTDGDQYQFTDDSLIEENGETDGAGGAGLLYPPDPVVVVEQNLHYADDGSLVVDVILEVDDQPNLVKYDIRLAKVDTGSGGSLVVGPII